MPMNSLIITRLTACALAVAALAGPVAAQAQAPHGPKYATVAAAAAPAAVKRGSSGTLLITIAVANGFHLNSARPNDPSLIATAFSAASTPGIHFGTAQYPKDQFVKTAGSDKPIPAYTGTVKIKVPFTVDRSARPGKAALGGTLTYQGCNATACYPPKQDRVSAPIVVR